MKAYLERIRLDDSTVMPEGWGTSAREGLAELAPKPSEFPDFSLMPQEIADIARMLDEAKEKSGTLICFRYGDYSPVEQSQCEDCGARVPQTAKARWAYGWDR